MVKSHRHLLILGLAAGAILLAGIVVAQLPSDKTPGQAVLDRLNPAPASSPRAMVLDDGRVVQITRDSIVADPNNHGVPLSLPYRKLGLRVPADALEVRVQPSVQEDISGDGVEATLLVKIRHNDWSFTCVDGPGTGKDTVGNELKVAIATIARHKYGEKLRAPILAGLEESGLSEAEACEMLRVQGRALVAESSETLLKRYVQASPEMLQNADAMKAAELGLLLQARDRVGHLVRLDRRIVGEHRLILANTVRKLKSAKGYRFYLCDSDGWLKARGWFLLSEGRTPVLERDAGVICWLLRLDDGKSQLSCEPE